jgi:acyl phosphate:glycerol-3-phosphate acyltransferase
MELSLVYKITGLIVFAYFLGSIPWGLLLTRCFTSVNILEEGSGNIGATNVRRLAGSHFGLMTLAGDVLKGLVPVFLARNMSGSEVIGSQFFIYMVALSSFLGHLFPIYLKFKNGGKGVATTFGCFLVISPWGCLASLFTFIIVICISNRVSIGSLCASAVLPMAVWIETGLSVFAVCTMIFTIMIFLRHIDNIKRILRGTEPVIWKKNRIR